jgi:hypothetical protein
MCFGGTAEGSLGRVAGFVALLARNGVESGWILRFEGFVSKSEGSILVT